MGMLVRMMSIKPFRDFATSLSLSIVLVAKEFHCRRHGGLVVERQTPEREVGVRSSLGLPCFILEQDTFTSLKVLVIPRKQWLRPDMTEKLLTGT